MKILQGNSNKHISNAGVSSMTGYGESTQHRGRSYESLVGDIEDLAKDLGVDKFYIAAVSGGGPYALAAATLIPSRVKGLLLLSAAGSPGMIPSC